MEVSQGNSGFLLMPEGEQDSRSVCQVDLLHDSVLLGSHADILPRFFHNQIELN